MGRPRKGDISAKQETFCQEYLVDLNGTQAAIRAGYSPFSARDIACDLLTKANIRARLDQLMAARRMRTEVSQDWVVRELLSVAEKCREGSPVYDKMGNPVLVETDAGKLGAAYVFDSKGAAKALELLGKHLGMYTDKKELSGPGGAAIPLEIVVNYGNSTKPTND